MFGLTILGNNSAIPAYDRHPTAQVLTYEDQIYLIDCGEGTQMQLQRYKIRRGKIHHIFISHLHGDHYFGLIGLLTSLELMGRDAPLHLYGPAALEAIIRLQLEAAGTRLRYELQIHALPENGGKITTGSKMEVYAYPVMHRVPCWGFLFREQKPPRRLVQKAAYQLGVPPAFFHRLQLGEDYVHPDGNIVCNTWVTTANSPGRSYAYSADTLYHEGLCDWVKNCDLLYHEATYLHDFESRAKERFHSTARQAALIACHAGVQRLLIGHFSSKYDNLKPFEQEARSVFAHADLALEGVTYRILNRQAPVTENPSPAAAPAHSTVQAEAATHFQ